MRRATSLTTMLIAVFAASAVHAQSIEPAQAASQDPTTPLSPDEMEAASGGDGVSVEVLTRQQLSGTTSGNTVTAGTLTSGDVNFSGEALNGFNGVGNFVVNTGANNTLQGAINISIVTTPGS